MSPWSCNRWFRTSSDSAASFANLLLSKLFTILGVKRLGRSWIRQLSIARFIKLSVNVRSAI